MVKKVRFSLSPLCWLTVSWYVLRLVKTCGVMISPRSTMRWPFFITPSAPLTVMYSCSRILESAAESTTTLGLRLMFRVPLHVLVEPGVFHSRCLCVGGVDEIECLGRGEHFGGVDRVYGVVAAVVFGHPERLVVLPERMLSKISVSTIPLAYTFLSIPERNLCSEAGSPWPTAVLNRCRLMWATSRSILTTGMNERSMLSRIRRRLVESRSMGVSAGAVSSWYFHGWLSS